MERRILSVIGLFALFLISTVVMVNVDAIVPSEPEPIIVETIFIKGHMKHNLVIGVEYSETADVEALFIHAPSLRTFKVLGRIDEGKCTFSDMKKMPAGWYYIEIHINSLVDG
jgi:hypothetical protein